MENSQKAIKTAILAVACLVSAPAMYGMQENSQSNNTGAPTSPPINTYNPRLNAYVHGCNAYLYGIQHCDHCLIFSPAPGTATVTGYVSHVNLRHSAPNMIRCIPCKITLSTIDAANNHMATTHNDASTLDRPFLQCGFCNEVHVPSAFLSHQCQNFRSCQPIEPYMGE